MLDELIGWARLQFIVGNFKELYEFYFSVFKSLEPGFRIAAKTLIYSGGLAWLAFVAMRAPVDRFKAAVYVFGMIMLAGYLVSSHENPKNLGKNPPKDISVGAYYGLTLVGNSIGLFESVVQQAFASNLGAAAGGTNSRANEWIAIAYSKDAQAFADKFLAGEAKNLYNEYHSQCAPQLLNVAKTEKQRNQIRAVGVGSNVLGMTDQEITSTHQNALQTLVSRAELTPEEVADRESRFSWIKPDQYSSNKKAALEMLDRIKPETNTIDGTKGYKLPTKAVYEAAIGATSDDTDAASYHKHSNLGDDFKKMKAEGATEVVPNSDADELFYPKNCKELYLLTDKAMGDYREAVKNAKGYENLAIAQAYLASNSFNKIRQAQNNDINKTIGENGGTERLKNGMMDSAGDATMSALKAASNSFNEFMLQYKIPGMIASMAILTAMLLLCFPIFATFSVFFGHGVLITYLKLMALPFIVVLINMTLMTLSAFLIAGEKLDQVRVETFYPGGIDTASAMASMTTESIIFAVICGAELLIAKLLLWDDVRSATSFNPGNAVTNAAAQGAGMLGAIAKVLPMGRAAAITSAASKRSTATARDRAVSTARRGRESHSVMATQTGRPVPGMSSGSGSASGTTGVQASATGAGAGASGSGGSPTSSAAPGASSTKNNPFNPPKPKP